MSKVKVDVKNITLKAKFAQSLKDVTPGEFTLVTNFPKDNGNWLLIRLADGQTVIVGSGEMAGEHNAKRAKIFEEPEVAEGKEATFLPTLRIGVKKGELIYQAA